MELILIRGLPGSGKTTIAKTEFPEIPLVEADQFFTMENGDYHFKMNSTKDAHNWCMAETKRYLYAGHSVVVANTFTTKTELEPYFKMAQRFNANVRILEAAGDFSSIHNVPADIIQKMKDRWETLDLYVIREYFGIFVDI